MARPLRLQYSGALYHLTSRGNARQKIFLDDDDRELFMSTLSHVISRHGWLCHAYCLMDNHYHLIVETPRPNLSLGMRQLNGIYTQAFNRRHRRVGHLFQGRYKAILVEKEAHLLELCRYVVLNLSRVGSRRGVEQWRWSSYRATAGLASVPEFLTVDWILEQFGQKKGQARARYRAFVREGLENRLWEKLRGQIYLGSEQFIERHQKAGEEITEAPKVQRRAVRPGLKHIFSRGRDRGIGVAYLEYGYRMREIAEYLGVHYATVSRRLRELEKKRKRNV
ncbi:MAG: transposase [Deltaproteobacteria bacterium]|nr:transposase [Deltaproteobacteria bacterium]